MAGSPSALQGSEPSLSSPRQSRTNGFVSHSRATVVWPMWPGLTTQAGSSFSRRSMIELRRSSKLVAVAPRTPPTEPAKSVSPVKHSAPVDDEREHAVGVAGRVQRLDAEVAALDDVALVERAVGTARQARRPRAACASTGASG